MEIRSVRFVKGIRGTDDITHDGTPQIAFVGRSNVGKSSLINSMVGKSVAIVGKKPGKTTEINYFLVNSEIYVVDLPGYGYAKATPKERVKLKNLIIWYLTYSEARPKKIVLVVDAKVGVTEFDRQMIGILKEHAHPLLMIANKIDKLSQGEQAKQLATMREFGAEVLPYSSKTAKRTDSVREAIFA